MNARLASTLLCTGLLLGCPVTPIPAADAPEVLAEQICEQLFECDCDQVEFYGDVDTCIAQKQIQISDAIDEVAAAGGSWSPKCAGELAAVWSKWECLGRASAREKAEHLARACELTHGSKQIGEDCRHGIFGDECSPGLACVDSVCRDALEFPLPKNAICEYEYEDLPCDDDLWCGYESNICEPYPEAGADCSAGSNSCGPAEANLYCDWQAQRCRLLPDIGESCADTFECRLDAYCDGGQDLTCQPRREIGQGCLNNDVCIADARCVDNICTLAPAVCDLSSWP